MDKLYNKKILLVIAHADDEIIIGWPIFQESKIEKHILLLSTDENNKDRKWCNKRSKVLKDICKHFGIGLTTFPNPSGFYKTPTRKADFILDDIYNNTIKKMKQIKKEFNFDYVFTHNPHGEYGHCDHRMCFDIVHHRTDYPVLITDIVHKKNWPTYSEIPKRVRDKFYTNIIANCELNMDIYSFCEKMYRKNKFKQNCWTHNNKPWDKCSLYLIE